MESLCARHHDAPGFVSTIAFVRVATRGARRWCAHKPFTTTKHAANDHEIRGSYLPAMRTRLRRLRDKETRQLIGVILGGKLLGVLTLLGLMKAVGWYFESAAGATPVAPIAHKANDFVSPINTVWVLVTAFLVFFMQAGFMALEAGFARSRETVNILLECVFDTCLCG